MFTRACVVLISAKTKTTDVLSRVTSASIMSLRKCVSPAFKDKLKSSSFYVKNNNNWPKKDCNTDNKETKPCTRGFTFFLKDYLVNLLPMYKSEEKIHHLLFLLIMWLVLTTHPPVLRLIINGHIFFHMKMSAIALKKKPAHLNVGACTRVCERACVRVCMRACVLGSLVWWANWWFSMTQGFLAILLYYTVEHERNGINQNALPSLLSIQLFISDSVMFCTILVFYMSKQEKRKKINNKTNAELSLDM